MKAQPFKIEISDTQLDDLKQRLKLTNWPDDLTDDWWYGVPASYLKELVDYWINSYDWKIHEQQMNTFNNYMVEIEGNPIHFIHERGKGPNPIPLILSHGWPWTFWDLNEVIGPLSDPASYGGNPEDAFDVVVPSLPGFAFSSPMQEKGMNFWRTADIWEQLMTEVLDYKKFGAQGGDWGALVTTQLGHKYADSLIGIHLTNAIPLTLFHGERPWILGDKAPWDIADETQRKKVIAQAKTRQGHVVAHILDPQTLSYAMHDSPVGLCAWILERRRNWSDCDGDVEKKFSKDHLITTMMLYWLTNTFVTSVRYYAEAAWNRWSPAHNQTPIVQAPTGISFFKDSVETAQAAEQARSAAAESFNLHYSNFWPSGGHFSPKEEPQAVIEDIRATFRELR